MKINGEITTAYGSFKGQLFCSEKDKRPLVVFLHGFPDDSSVWNLQIEALKDSYHVWAPDLYTHAFKDQVHGVAEGIKTLSQNSSVILVGHDMGGPLACEIARLYPDLITKVLLINTLSLHQFMGRWKNPRQWVRSAYMPLFIGPLHTTSWWKILAKHFLNNAYDLGGLPKDDPARDNSPEVLEGIKRYREILLELPKHLHLVKEKIKHETHFFFGLNDPFLIPPHEEELSEQFSSYTIEVIPTGHWPQKTADQEVTHWIKKVSVNG